MSSDDLEEEIKLRALMSWRTHGGQRTDHTKKLSDFLQKYHGEVGDNGPR